MNKLPSLFSTALQELFSVINILWILFFAAFYLLFTVFVLNYRLVIATTNSFPLSDKLTILFSLIAGLFTAFSPLDSVLIVISALLVGINLVLMGKTIYRLEHSGKVKFSIGGGALLSLISAGCSSCGFSLLSILGFGSSLSFLPFHGTGLHVISLTLLLFSAVYMLKKLRDSVYCKV